MNTAFLVGLRFSMGQKGSAYLSFITRVSIFGLTLGVIALVVVVSVMNGFDSQLKLRILGAVPHLIVPGESATNPAVEPLVQGSARFVRYEGMIVGRGEARLVAIYGIDPDQEARVSIIPDHIVEGSLKDLAPGSYNMLLGSSLAARFGLWPGSSTTMLIPVPSDEGNTVLPKIARTTLAGTFTLGSEMDYGLVLLHIDDLQKIVGKADAGQRITLHNIFDVEKYIQLAGLDGNRVEKWSEEYGDFFETVKMEKLMMFLLLTLIVMIAAFNTISGLSMMVKDKQSEIAVLRTMGLAKQQVTMIFVVQGVLIGLSGVVLGLCIGVPLAYHVTEIVGAFEDMLGGRMLAGTYFDRVPTDVRFDDLIVIACVSLGITVLATIYPAYRASKVEPAAVLRAE